MGADIKEVHSRIKSVESTRHITKAMELVASAKTKKATEKMEKSRFYKKVMMDAFSRLSGEKNVYTTAKSKNLPELYIVVAGDRGLAGGYNSNIFRSARAVIDGGDIVIPIGKRAIEYFVKNGGCYTDAYSSSERFSADDASTLSRIARDMFASGRVSSVNVISTKYVSSFTQTPEMTRILPILKDVDVGGLHGTIEFEPSAAVVLERLIPDYIAGILYSSVAESFAAELAARRSAMDTATKNADEMKEKLILQYNRARQGSITQEITEIVAGANK